MRSGARRNGGDGEEEYRQPDTEAAYSRMLEALPIHIPCYGSFRTNLYFHQTDAGNDVGLIGLRQRSLPIQNHR